MNRDNINKEERVTDVELDDNDHSDSGAALNADNIDSYDNI